MKRKTLNKGTWLIIGLFALLISSCGEKPHFDQFYAFDLNEWSQDVKPRFEVEVKDTSKWYDMVITLRTTTDYAHSNLWIFLNSETPSGATAREPYQFYIADERGAWLGRKSGTFVENEIVFRKRKFPEPGVYSFVLEQAITEETIDEVINVGLSMFEYQTAKN